MCKDNKDSYKKEFKIKSQQKKRPTTIPVKKTFTLEKQTDSHKKGDEK